MTKKSTSSFCVYLGGNLISWGSKKQSIISRSSTEAEYHSLALVATEMVWIHSLLTDLNIILHHPLVLWYDNLSAVHLSLNYVLHSKTKHVKINIYYVRDLVFQRKIEVRHLPATEQITDVLTKPLSATTFQKFKRKLTMVDVAALGLEGVLRQPINKHIFCSLIVYFLRV